MSSHYEKFLATGEVKCIDDEIPFEIPEGWEWIRLSSIVSILGDGIHGTPEYDDTGDIFFVNGNNLNNGKIIIKADTKRLNRTEANKHRRALDKNTILVSINGTIGNIAFYNNENIILGKSACYFNILGNIDKDYIKLIIESDYFISYAKSVATGSTIKNVPLNGMRNFLVPLPPIKEQTRIVSKMSDLSVCINNYSRLQKEVNRLNHKIFTQFERSILQEAIQGKLVPQDPNDEPASVLLERIREEKQLLLKEGKLKKKDITDSIIFQGEDNKYYEQIGKEVVDISEDIPFEIPESWSWSRLSILVNMRIGKTPARGDSTFWNNGVHAWISISDLSQGDVIMTSKEKISDFAASSVMGVKSKAGSLLMSFKLTVGKTAILGIDAYHNEAIVTISTVCDENYYTRNYLAAILPLLTNYGDTKDAIKGKTLNSQSLNALLIPIPPHEEQRRIIENIQYLFSKLR